MKSFVELVSDILGKGSEVTSGRIVGQGYPNRTELQHRGERSLSQLREDSVGIPDPLVTSCPSNIKSVVEELTQRVKWTHEDVNAMSRVCVKMPVTLAHAWNPHVGETEMGGFLGLSS